MGREDRMLPLSGILRFLVPAFFALKGRETIAPDFNPGIPWTDWSRRRGISRSAADALLNERQEYPHSNFQINLSFQILNFKCARPSLLRKWDRAPLWNLIHWI